MAAWLFVMVLAAVAAVWKIWQLFRQVVWSYSFVSGSMEEVKRLQSLRFADFQLSFWARDFKISRDTRILTFENYVGKFKLMGALLMAEKRQHKKKKGKKMDGCEV
ncbi:unnamed protein product [Linum trigynum]|uniref:Uncharacterized protein n=1 Tax=Linum trigynum TaxID=586398 RepID=A0AAV2E6U2_9ROSI